MEFKNVIIIIGIVLLLLSSILIYRSTMETRTFTVKDKERIVKSKSKSSYYLVWTEEGNVYKIADSFSFLKFNSSDRYGQLEIGKTYTADVAGWRVRFLSMYENIIRLTRKESKP